MSGTKNNSDSRFATFESALEHRERQLRKRNLQPLDHEKRIVNFCSNDYLGLADHPKVKERSKEYITRWGTGARASRLVSGSLAIHDELEQRLADFTKRDRSLVFNSGYQANSTIIPAITDRNTLILADKKSHNSLLFGAMASRGRLLRFTHNDPNDLGRLLDTFADDYQQILIITESVFSMDGDRAPLTEIAELADQFGALLYVDDAHAIGILGKQGRGLAASIDRIDLLIGTFGKAFGSSGAFVAGSSTMIEYLVNFCSGFIYTTGLPPATVGAVAAALDLIPDMTDQRNRVQQQSDRLKAKLHEMGWETAGSQSQIVPAVIGEDQEAIDCSQYLEQHNILCSAIRPPTVPEGTARLRFTVTTKHDSEDITTLIELLNRYQRD